MYMVLTYRVFILLDGLKGTLILDFIVQCLFKQEELDAQPDEVAVGPLRWGTTSTSAYGNWKTVK